jgi:hypothetical protein
MTEPSRMMRLFSSVPPSDDPLWLGDFDILDPQPAQIRLADIAHGLAGKFRFAGQSPIRKTVARHSLEVADRCTAPIAKVWGLFHDAAEAYLGDIPTPHKHLLWVQTGAEIRPAEVARTLRPFWQIEARILAAIAQRFDLPWPIPADVAAEVHAADEWALDRDQRTLWHDFDGGEKIAMLPESGRVCHDRAAWLVAAGESRAISRGRCLLRCS